MRSLFILLSAIFVAKSVAFVPGTSLAPTFSRTHMDTRRHNLLDTFSSILGNFGKQATASHILIGPGSMDEVAAKAKLEELKAEIDNDPIKFAEAAKEYSSCPSSKKGGDLGTFGPGMMVKNFDKVCFEEEVGKVHGPVSTQFGEHLIYIAERTGEKE